MNAQKVSFNIPTAMAYFLAGIDYSKNPKVELERNALILYQFINNFTISHGRAAEILGITKQELIELYGDMGISYINQDVNEAISEADEFLSQVKK